MIVILRSICGLRGTNIEFCDMSHISRRLICNDIGLFDEYSNLAMPKEFLYDALKIDSDRHLNILKKDYSNIGKLLKKAKRQYITKYKKGLVKRDVIINFFDNCKKYLKDKEDDRLADLKKLIDEFIKTKSNEKVQNNGKIVKLDEQGNEQNIRNRELISVDEERDSLAVLNKTLTGITESKTIAMEVDEENDCNVDHSDKVISNNVTTDDMDATINAIYLNEESVHTQAEMTKISPRQQLRISLDDILCPPLKDGSSQQPIQEIEESGETSKTSNINDNTTVCNEMEFTEISSVVSSVSNKIISSINSNETPSNETSNNVDCNTYSIDSLNSLNKLKNKMAHSNSISSTLSASKNTQHSLYKSAHHKNFGSTQKLDIKPQVNSAMKRKLEDSTPQRKQEIIRNQRIKEENERNLKIEREKKLKEQNDRRLKLEKDRKLKEERDLKVLKLQQCSDKAKIICQTKVIPQSSTKDTSKGLHQGIRTLTKLGPTNNKDKINSEARVMLQPIKAAVTGSSQQRTAIKTPQHSTASSNIRPPSLLKPTNKTSLLKNVATVPSAVNASYKTPQMMKSKPTLSESCRKIIVNHESYSLDGLDSENSDDDDVEGDQVIPSWADKQTGTLGRLANYHSGNTDPSKLFYPPSQMKVITEQVFRNYNFKIKARASSAVWRH